MKNRLVILIILMLMYCFPGSISAVQYTPEASNRLKININRSWKSIKEDINGAEAPGYNDSSWDNTHIPHSFCIPYWREHSWWTGIGWYRKHFAVRPEWSGKRISIEFEGAFQHAWVYVNGNLIGEHKGGYTPFILDITDHVISTGDNILAIRLSTEWNPDITPRAGEYQFTGGIYRDVYLVVTDPLHVTFYGTFVTTPYVSVSSATVNFKTEVINESNIPKNCTVKTTIVDANNEIVAVMEDSYNIEPGLTYTFSQDSGRIDNPHLWQPAPGTPYLYKVYTTVRGSGVPVDDFISPLGFRWFRYDPNNGFFINGKHVYLRGFNIHQDHAGWAAAVPNSGQYRDVKLLADMNGIDGKINFIRGCHYPKDPAFVQACDELGFLLYPEAGCIGGIWKYKKYKESGFWNADAYPYRKDKEFIQNCKDTLTMMIRRFRNHPSITLWGIGDAMTWTDHPKKVEALMIELRDLSKTIDPTRPVTAALEGSHRGDQDYHWYCYILDVIGNNFTKCEKIQEDHECHPDKAIILTEFGSCWHERPGGYDCDGRGPLECGSTMPFCAGECVWTAYDYGTHFEGWGRAGIFDHYRLPKRFYYKYRNDWGGIPPPQFPSPGTPAKLGLTADKTAIATDGTDDCQVVVTIKNNSGVHISNNINVNLSVTEGSGMFPWGTSIDLVTPDGLAAIEFRSYTPGVVVITATSPGLPPATIMIETLGDL